MSKSINVGPFLVQDVSRSVIRGLRDLVPHPGSDVLDVTSGHSGRDVNVALVLMPTSVFLVGNKGTREIAIRDVTGVTKDGIETRLEGHLLFRAFDSATQARAMNAIARAAGVSGLPDHGKTRRDALAALSALTTLCVVSDCALIGGFGHGSAILQATHSLYFTHDALLVVESGLAETVAHMDYQQILALRVDGPGAVTSGGGFVGGGFGLEGAAEGMIVASLLNALSQRTKVQTLLEVQDQGSDFIFFTSTTTPEQLRTTLMPVRAKLRAASVHASPEPTPSPSDSLDRLERLARLFQQGLLTAEEFQSAKRTLLGP